MKKQTITAMRKWLHDLDRAIINRQKGVILQLLDENQLNVSFKWDAPGLPEDLIADYELFTDRANNIVYV